MSVFPVTSELLTKDYTETYYQEDGTRVTTTPDDIVSICISKQVSVLQCDIPQTTCKYISHIYMILKLFVTAEKNRFKG